MSVVYFILGIVFTAIPFIIALALPFLLVIFMISLYRSPVTGAVGILMLYLLETLLVYLVSVNLGLTVYPQDLLFVPMALVALIRMGKHSAGLPLPRALWVLVAMMFMAFLVGLVQNGTSAGVQFRTEFYVLAGIFYFSSFTWSEQQISSVLKALFFVAVLAMLIVWYRWAADALGLDWFTPAWRNADSTGVALRVINAAQALLLGQVFILIIYGMAMGKSMGRWMILIPPLALTILVLQHRTVWVATFLPALMAFVIVKQNKAKLASRLGAIAMVSAIVLVPLLATGKFESATSSVSDLAVRATSTTGGTFVGRVEGWDSLLKQWAGSGPRVWVIGSPYGSGFNRAGGAGEGEITYAPHDYFVQLLLRVGLIGLAAFLAFYAWLIRKTISLGAAPSENFTGYAMIALLIGELLFDVPYSPSYTEGLFIGLIVALIRQHAAADAKAGTVRQTAGLARSATNGGSRGTHALRGAK